MDEQLAEEEERRKRNGKMSAPMATGRHVSVRSDPASFDLGDQTAVEEDSLPSETNASSVRMKRHVSRSSAIGDPDDPFGPGVDTPPPPHTGGSDEPAATDAPISSSARRSKITPTESANRAVSGSVLCGFCVEPLMGLFTDGQEAHRDAHGVERLDTDSRGL